MMSISINSYSDNSSYRTTQSKSSSDVSTETYLPKKPADSVQFSEQLMELLSGYSYSNTTSTGIYGSDSGEYELSVEQKTSILSNMQANLNASSSSNSHDKGSDMSKALATLKEELSGFDADTATEQEVSDLFDQITQTLENVRPAPPKDREQTLTKEQLQTIVNKLQDELDSVDASALTNEQSVSDLFEEVMQTLESLRPAKPGNDAPPRALRSKSDPALTTEQKAAFLAQLQSKLNAINE